MRQVELADLAASIADGTFIDWERLDLSSSVSGELAASARIVDGVARVHAGLPPLDTYTRSLQESLRLIHDSESIVAAFPGPTWGPLTIIGKIGRGTFGDVYVAHDPRLNRRVALKLLRRRTDRDDSTVIDEGHLMARVHHPNVVTVFGAERIDGRVGLWMEYIEGATLEQELQGGPLATGDIQQIGLDLASALAAVHGAGLVHRDLKAQNVMRDRNRRTRLMDFGAGREMTAGHVSTAGELAGTPLYLAPELLRGEPATPATDVYSLGVLLFHIATGSYPVRGRSLQQLRDAHDRGDRPRIRDLRVDLPRWLAAAIDRACSPDASGRYQTAEELMAVLQRRRGVLWTAGAATAALVIAGTALAYRPLDPQVAGTATGIASSARNDRIPILITHIENKSGEAVFEGADYALEQELASSTPVTVVSRHRIEDALRSMKRPADTVIDATVGREVAIRDGGIGAVVTGQIDKGRATYIVSTQLLTAATGVAMQTISEETPDQTGVITLLRGQAIRLRQRLAERREQIAISSVPVEHVTTRSLVAFQLYNQAFQLGLSEQWDVAETVARRIVQEDPDFAVGWTFLAWTIRRAHLSLQPMAAHYDPRLQALQAEMRPMLDRSMQLRSTASDWERYWIEASFHTLLGHDDDAIVAYKALLRVRPDHVYAANNITEALRRLGRTDELLEVEKSIVDAWPHDARRVYLYVFDAITLKRDVASIKPYLDRLKEMPAANPPEQKTHDDFLEWLPTYVAWDAGDVKSVLATVEGGLARAQARGERVSPAAGYFSMALGRLREARSLFAASSGAAVGRDPDLLVVADAADDNAEMYRLSPFLAGGPSSRAATRFSLLVRGGHVDRAREILSWPRSKILENGGCFAPVCDTGMIESGIGDVLLHDGRLREAIPHLERGLVAFPQFEPREYYQDCETLATAHEQLDAMREAEQVLEKCAASRPRYIGPFFDGPPFWMRLRLHLADDYRLTGRLADAENIEEDVRRLLIFADPDNPLVQRLSRRAQSQ